MSGAGEADLGPLDEAGEFVLGTLDERERADAERRRDSDAAFGLAVGRWETRLAPLAMLSPEVAPPGWVWRRLSMSIAAAGLGNATRPPPARPSAWSSIGVWRAATGASLALAASLALVVSIERGRVPQGGTALVAYGRPDAAFVVQREASGALDVRPVAPAGVPSGRDLELWALAAGAKAPVALGVLPASGARVPAGRLPAGAVKILVSLEPAGGSPGPLPTGPVLYAGSLSGR